MKYNTFLVALLLMGTASFTSCEKAIIEDDDTASVTQKGTGTTNQKNSGGNVVLRVSGFVQRPFDDQTTRSVIDLTNYCTRLNFVVYKDGTKVKGLSQKQEDGGFGEVSMELEPGTYKLLVLAHSSVGGNPVVSDPENISFTNALGYSDTFSYYDDLEVTSETKTHSLTLSRNVSLLRFTINDSFPADVKYMHFYYTGGSGVLNAVTGYGGNVNSKQEKLVNVSTFSAPLTFNLYTFLQQDEATLKVRVSALSSDQKTVIAERTFDNVNMKHCMVTEYTGYFFDTRNSFSISAETDWGNPYEHVDY